MGFCKIVKVETADALSGGEVWVLTHECGKVEKRVRRLRLKRHERPAPVRVQCAGKPAGASDAP